MSNTDTRPSSKAPLVVGIIVALAIIGALIAWAAGLGKAPDTAEPETTTSTVPEAPASSTATTTPKPVATPPRTTPPPVQPPVVPAEPHKYKNGTYQAVGTYHSPAGSESVNVSVTLKDDVITDATFTGNATNATSKQYQSRFASGYKALVVGKSIDAVSLTVVNGSSLAPKGFMDALAKIKVQAV